MTANKEHGLVFSAVSIPAIRVGLKTQTRRVASSRAAARIRAGDRIWVKESTAASTAGVMYRAEPETWSDGPGPIKCPIKWISPRYMRKAHARLILAVVEVRPELLQAISDRDALAEGVEFLGAGRGYQIGDKVFGSPREAFRAQWAAVNGAESWDSNPLVFAVTFDLVKDRTGKITVKAAA